MMLKEWATNNRGEHILNDCVKIHVQSCWQKVLLYLNFYLRHVIFKYGGVMAMSSLTIIFLVLVRRVGYFVQNLENPRLLSLHYFEQSYFC